jgi:hypothetical protein
LFHLLNSRLYVGEIVHKGRTFPGQHAGIIDREVFDAVQAQLRTNAVARSKRKAPSTSAPLKGLVFDQDGGPMSPTVSYGKSGRAFRYYVSATLQQGQRRPAADDSVRRVSASQLEGLVLERMDAVMGIKGWSAAGQSLRRVELQPHCLQLMIASAGLKGGADDLAIDALQRRLDPADRLRLDRDGTLRLTIGMRPVFRGGRTWLINPKGAAASAKAKVDAGLIAALRKAHAGLAKHCASPAADLETLRWATSPGSTYERKLTELAFLAPDIQLAIIEGRQPPGLTAQQMTDRGVPVAWADQRIAFGFPC